LKPAANRPVKVVVIDGQNGAAVDIRTDEIRTAWMADASARIARDPALQDEAAHQRDALVGSQFGAAPWHPLAAAAGGQPLISAAASRGTLVLVSAAKPDALVTPLLLHAIAAAIAPSEDPAAAEIVPMSDASLRAWTRAPGAVIDPRVDTVERDDRRWLWGAALLLFAIESWVRRARPQYAGVLEPEESRVA
jgi:hypothetical protein